MQILATDPCNTKQDTTSVSIKHALPVKITAFWDTAPEYTTASEIRTTFIIRVINKPHAKGLLVINEYR
jgi:hypothetical protein